MKFKARPIEPTPILRGEDAKRFYEDLDRSETNPDAKKAKFIKECIECYRKKPF